MTDALATKTPDLDTAALMERVIIEGDLSKLQTIDRVKYYVAVCRSVGLNPLTKPFEYLYLQNKMTLYARKEATDQLRVLHGVKVTKLEHALVDGVYTVTAYGVNRTGRTDAAMGAVAVEALRGLDKANAMMKAETKAKRRLTLSLCGLGVLDESEVDAPLGAVQATEVMQLDTAAGTSVEVPVGTLFTSPEDDRKALVQRARVAAARLDKKRVSKLRETWLGSPDAEYETCELGSLVSLVRDLEGERL